MLAALGAWLATQGASMLLGALAKLLLDGFNSWQADQAQRRSGAAEAAAAASAKTVETLDAMEDVARPSDGDVADSLRSGKF